MSQRKKIIAVCMTKPQDYSHSLYLQCLHKQAIKNDFKLIVFSSFVDFFNNDFYDQGEASIFGLINFDVIDALIVQLESFQNKSCITPTIEEAKKRGLPVLCVNEVMDGCYSLIPDFSSAYRSIVNHVIQDHEVTDSFFIAGRKGDRDSEARLTIYKSVLEDNDLPFSDNQVDYGDYWELPTINIVTRLHNEGRIPRAIFCANDYMALAAIEKLQELGYRVPEDVIVTGFDGVAAGTYSDISLTTCSENQSSLADLSIAIIKRAMTGKLPTDVFRNSYSARFSCSCGCMSTIQPPSSNHIARLHHSIDVAYLHEDLMYNWINRVCEMPDVYAFMNGVANVLMRDSCLCLNEDLGHQIQEHRAESDCISDNVELLFSTSIDIQKLPSTPTMRKKQMIPSFDAWLEDDCMSVCCSLHSDNLVCGYYTVSTNDIAADIQSIKRVSKTLNIAVGILIRRMHQISMIRNIENAAFIDVLSGLSNLTGVNQWFESFAKKPSNHNKTLAISVYALPKYSYIMENFGIYELEEVIHYVANALVKANTPSTHISRIADDEFLLIDVLDDSAAVDGTINHATSTFYGQIEEFNQNNAKDYYIEVNAGCAVIPAGWNDTLENFIRQALGEMYQNRLASNPGEIIKEVNSPRDFYGSFNLLLDKNLFVYHFQPIVDAKTGAIFAYEALMRTTGGVNMSPLDVLATAKEYKRLYDIEKATLFNVMNRYIRDYKEFGGCKIFINTIPGHFLNDEDCNKLHEQFESYLDCFVYELTEQDSVTEEELNSIKRLGKNGSSAMIAIDDYGTGHSNIVNLLRYSPSIIKIDRYLISDLDKDPNKQMFVRNTIEFGRMNNIKVLAEGVETFEEMKTVIDFGVNYIQGYYTAKPQEKPVVSINPRIQNEIIAENIRLRVSDSEPRVYHPEPREEMDVMSLFIRDYGTISLPTGEYTLKGCKDKLVAMNICIEQDAEVTLHLENVYIESRTLLPCIDLRLSSKLNLVLHGKNHFEHVGIHVPESASLHVTGDGNLYLNHDRNYSTGIGANFEEPCGEMIFDITGTLEVVSNGDRVVSIGGQGTIDAPMQFRRGNYKLSIGGNVSVAVGTSTGDCKALICEDVSMDIDARGHDIVCLGSLGGIAEIECAGNMKLRANGDRAVCIGTHSQEAKLRFSAGSVTSTMFCEVGAGIGTIEGVSNISITNGNLNAYGEGNRITGFGATIGSGKTIVTGGILHSTILAGLALPFGNDHTDNRFMGGNIIIPDDLSVEAKNLKGEDLYCYATKAPFFEAEVSTADSDYTYLAEGDPETMTIHAYLPKVTIDGLNE